MQVMWLNHSLRQFWPWYNKAIGQMILEQAKPMIDDSISSVRLSCVCACVHVYVLCGPGGPLLPLG